MTVIKKFTLPPDPFGVVKGQIIKFRNYSVSYQYFYCNFACRQRYNKYETYHPLDGLWGWDQKVKIQLFHNLVMMHIKSKGINNAAAW